MITGSTPERIAELRAAWVAIMKRQARHCSAADLAALDAATVIMAIPPSADLPGGDCQRKARIQCAVRDAIARCRTPV